MIVNSKLSLLAKINHCELGPIAGVVHYTFTEVIPGIYLVSVSAYFYTLATVLLPTVHGRLLSTLVRSPS
jgi:hypothetical protein